MGSFVNLDKIAASASQSFLSNDNGSVLNEREKINPQGVERLVTNALGVLQEEGVYALIIYLCSNRVESSIASVLLTNLVNVLNELKIPSIAYSRPLSSNIVKRIEDQEKILEHFSSKVASDLDSLLLVKGLYEQILIYSRYGAKAFSNLEEGAQ